MRQSQLLKEYDPKRGISVTTLAYEYSAKFEIPEHGHGADQLIYAIRGVMEVFSNESMWLIPPFRGLDSSRNASPDSHALRGFDAHVVFPTGNGSHALTGLRGTSHHAVVA